MEYFRIALIDEKTYSAQALLSALMRSSKRMARGRLSKKFSSITKNDCTPSFRSMSCMTSNSWSPVS